MINDRILQGIMSKVGSKIIRALPRNEKDAITTRQLGKLINIPQTTIYRNLKPLYAWSNLGQISKRTPAHPEIHFYLKRNFTIVFKNNKITIVLHKKRINK